MSAKDDASIASADSRFRLTTLALALVAGVALGVGMAVVGAPSSVALFEVRVPWSGDQPRAAEWPAGAPRAGETARVETGGNGLVLAVRAPRAPRARALAAELRQRRESGTVALAEAQESVASAWKARLRPEPLPALSPGADCAAWLYASAGRSRDLARALPAPWAAAPLAERPSAPVAVLERLQEVHLAARASDPAAVHAALLPSERAASEWFASGVPSPGASAAERGSAWRQYRLDRADSLESEAGALLVGETALQLSLARAAAAERVVTLGAELPEPYAELVRPLASAPPVPSAAPIPDAWARLLGAGAALGGLAALLTAALGLWFRRRIGADSLLVLPAREPGDRGAWLHVVSGPNSAAVARAVLELSAHALARGERVLAIDGGSRLKLHERFGREARWGLMECLLADMPVLGLVQYGGRPGFYLLAHGNTTRGEGWASLGQRLDDVRPHFGRIVLALDSHAPRAIGDALAGRALEGWWADAPGRFPRTVGEMSGRLGIAFSGMDLSVMPEVSLEVLSGRIRALAPLAPPAAEAPALLPLAGAAPPPAPIHEGPVVLDCDLQVLQRLRFLAWMRRVQSENRTVEEASVH